VIELNDLDETEIDKCSDIKQIKREGNMINLSYEVNGILFVKNLNYRSSMDAITDFNYIEDLAVACEKSVELLVEESYGPGC